MFSFKELIEEGKRTGCTCWTGYKRKPGTDPCESGSCIKEGERGLWDNIHAKQKRIKAGSGEHMRKPGSKGAPTAAALKASQTNEEDIGKHNNATTGFKPLVDKLTPKYGKEVAGKIAGSIKKKVMAKEEVDQIAELDTKTLKSYVNKNLKSNDTSDKRDTGLYRATNKIAKSQATSTLDKKVKTLGNTSASAHKNRYEYEASRSELKDRGIHNFAGRRTRTEELNMEAKDEREYGYEGDMALNQLKTLVRCAEMIEDMLKPDTDLPEWVQSKITLATDYIQTAADYLYSEMKEEVEEQFDLIEELVMDLADEHNIDPEVIWEKFESIDDEQLYEAAVDAKGYKSSTGGLTQKGRDAYNSKGAHLQAPVTTPPSKLKAGSKAANRRKSFCARMGGMEGPMKKPNGEPTRKALALRKWNC